MLSAESEQRVRQHFIQVEGFDASKVCKRLHVTLYHARTPIEAIEEGERPVSIVTHSTNWRMMVMASGGENARPDIDATTRSVGIRIQRAADAARKILEERSKFFQYETRAVLGGRERSDHRRSAFGAMNYQPHMTVLKAGAGHGNDLKAIGERFRGAIGLFAFDRILIRKYEPEQ